VKNIMENKKRIIMLFIAVSGFFMCLNGVSAVNVNIDITHGLQMTLTVISLELQFMV
jgi:hypothetical protein